MGSNAVLLDRPQWDWDRHCWRDGQNRTETVNDADGYCVNFWRSVQKDPEQTAYYADAPVYEIELHAKHYWLLSQKNDLVAKLEGNPDFYDCKIAGWWAWGMSCFIGGGFCSGEGSWVSDGEKLVKIEPGTSETILIDNGVSKGLPTLRNSGEGVNRVGISRKIPILGNGGLGTNRVAVDRSMPDILHKGVNRAGISHSRVHVTSDCGVNRALPHLSGGGQGITRSRVDIDNKGVNRHGIYEWFNSLMLRLRRVRVCCGDWSRVMGPSVTIRQGVTGVILDPPYSGELRCHGVYSTDNDTVSSEVRKWCIENGDEKLLRIALCGYEGEHEMPGNWSVYKWTAQGGYGLQGEGRGRENREKECIWFSPHCLQCEQGRLF